MSKSSTMSMLQSVGRMEERGDSIGSLFMRVAQLESASALSELSCMLVVDILTALKGDDSRAQALA